MNSHRVKKDRRKEYTGSKRFDYSCRCHGGCEYCRDNKTYFDKKMRSAADTQLQEWKKFWNPDEPLIDERPWM